MKSKKGKSSFKDQFEALKNLAPFLKMVWKTNQAMTAANILLRIVKSIIPLLMLYVGKEIVDEVIHLISIESDDKSNIWFWLTIELVLAVLSELMNRAITLIDSLLGDLFSNKSSEQLIRHAAQLDLHQFEDSDFYDKLALARRQTTGRTILLSQLLTQLQEVVTVISLGAGLIYFNYWLIIILILAVVPSFLGETHFNQRTYSLTRGWTPERRELDYLRYIGASDETAKEIKIFGLSNFIVERFKTISDKYYHANRIIATKRAIWGILLSAIGTLAYYGAYVFIIVQTVGGIITVGTLTFLAGSFNRMRTLLQGIMNRFSKIAQEALYLKDYFEFLEVKPQIKSPEKSTVFPKTILEGFVFDNVSFKYHNSEKYAIKNLSFHLRPDEKLALVGENGAGKTTLVKLLARLYEPTSGAIYLDGKPLQSYNLEDLRSNIGIIFQDYIRFHMKASENIAIGGIEQLDELPTIKMAAKKSLADAMVSELPREYEQMLGKRFANGVELSGGQWQKVALARAYMRDAQLLILDEPTSALDARAEHEVFKRFAELIEGKAAVLISHRFSTVRMADRILFLEHGKLLELGSHEELLAKKGKYSELFKLQAQGYL